MAKKQKTKDAPPLTQRIATLSKLLWDGNKSRMAKALRISHPVISRVIAGQQEPPGKLLVALAEWPNVNLRWLFLGEGRPQTDRDIGAGGGRFCPVAQCLLPGSPKDFPHLLTGTSLPVAEAFYSETAYYRRVNQDDPIVNAKDEKIKAEDFLLLETNADWTHKLDRLNRRLVAVFLDRAKGTIALGTATYELWDDLLEPEYPCLVHIFSDQVKDVRIEKTSKVNDAGGQTSPTRPKKGAKPESPIRLGLDDVVGVCIAVMRLQ